MTLTTTTAWTAGHWDFAARVGCALVDAHSWGARVPESSGLPDWLRMLVDGKAHAEASAPMPVLLRTQGLTRQWMETARRHPELTVTLRGDLPVEQAEGIFARAEELGAVPDADVYLFGDGRSFTAVFWELYATWPDAAAMVAPEAWGRARRAGPRTLQLSMWSAGGPR